jgi:hypothetical protein
MNNSKVYIAGNVGIGTTSPGFPFDVAKTAIQLTGNAYVIADLTNGGTTDYGMGIGYNNVNNEALFVSRGTGGTGFEFWTFDGSSWGSRVAINKNGSVGIGTTAPEAKLHVVDPGKSIIFTPAGSPTTALDNMGLELRAYNYLNGEYATRFLKADLNSGIPLFIQVTDVGGISWTNLARFGSYSGNSNTFETFGQTALATAGGNVGIATSTPTQKLEVVGKVKISGLGNSLIFPDASEQTTAFLGVGQEVTAARVSSGGFGTLSTKGNYWFEHFNSSAPVLYVDALNDRVGIGTTGPGTKLQIGTSVASAFPTLGTASGHLSLTGNGALWGMYAGLDDSGKGWIQQMRNDGATAYDLSLQPVGGNVGIGTTGPVHKLELATDTTAIGGIGFGTDTELYRSGANTLALASGDVLNIVNGSLQIGGTAVITSGRIVQSANGSIGAPAFTFSSDTNTGFYSGGADTLRLVTGGADRMSVDAAGNVSIAGNTILNGTLWLGGAMASSINMNSNDITNVNKLTVTTIDPVYEINGKKYATYVSDTIGLKVEYSGKAKLKESRDSQFRTQNPQPTTRTSYSYLIDFTKLAEGSDLWLFWQTSDEGEGMRDIVVTLTPEGGNAALWYELKSKERQIVIYGDAPVAFSYQLIAPRHDAKQWPTITKESSQGTKLRVK